MLPDDPLTSQAPPNYPTPKDPPPNYPVVQIAYHVPDAAAAAQQMYATFGAGPFFLIPNIQLQAAEHRGVACDFVHTSAYGQWGTVMLELVQQDSSGPSPFRDLFGPDERGLHHMATMVDDQAAAYAAYAAAGYEVATIATTLNGTEFAFIDTVSALGHFIEVYEKSPALESFYSMVREAAQDWSGEDPVRQL